MEPGSDDVKESPRKKTRKERPDAVVLVNHVDDVAQPSAVLLLSSSSLIQPQLPSEARFPWVAVDDETDDSYIRRCMRCLLQESMFHIPEPFAAFVVDHVEALVVALRGFWEEMWTDSLLESDGHTCSPGGSPCFAVLPDAEAELLCLLCEMVKKLPSKTFGTSFMGLLAGATISLLRKGADILLLWFVLLCV